MTRMEPYRPTFREWLSFGWWVFVLFVLVVVFLFGVLT